MSHWYFCSCAMTSLLRFSARLVLPGPFPRTLPFHLPSSPIRSYNSHSTDRSQFTQLGQHCHTPICSFTRLSQAPSQLILDAFSGRAQTRSSMHYPKFLLKHEASESVVNQSLATTGLTSYSSEVLNTRKQGTRARAEPTGWS